MFFVLQLYLGVLCFRLGATGVELMEWDISISEFIIFFNHFHTHFLFLISMPL